jgi:hypothetical protein
MFRPPRYDFASGLYRFGGGHRVVAQSQTHAGWSEAHKKRMGNSDPYSFTQSGMGGNRQIYSPIYERAEAPTLVEDFLPTDIKTQNKIFRNILQYDAIAGPATEYWCSMAFGKNVILNDVNDPEVLKFYEDATEACGLIPEFPLLLLDYLTIGRFVFFLVPNDKKGYWTEHRVLDPDFVRIKVPPFRSMTPVIDWQPDSEERDWAMSDDPRIKEQQLNVDPVILKAMYSGESVPLDPTDTLFLPRQQHMTDRYGTSYLCRMLPLKIYEKAAMDASIAGMRRRAGPVWIATCPADYTGTEISEIIDQLYAAEDDPIGGKVAVREGVVMSELGSKDSVLNIKDDWDFLSTAKMRSLGVSETVLSGETNFNTMDKVMSAFLEKLRGVRELFTRRILTEKIYKTLAKKHKFVKRTEAELSHRVRIGRKEEDESNLLIPTVEWDQPLEPTADRDYWDMLVQLKELGFPVQLRKWAQAAGYDFKKMLQNQQSELDDRAKMYALRKALKEQAEKFGFEEDGTPSGGLGGGAGGEAGGLDLGGGPEAGGGPELGGGGPPLGGGGGGGPELGGGLPEAGGAPEAAPPPATPAPAAGPGGAAADLQAARFNLVQPPQTYRRATVYSAKPYDLETELSKLPLWEKDTTALGLPRRRVAQLVEDVTHLEPHQRNRDEFYQRMRRQHGCTSVQADLVQYCAARVGLVAEPQLTADGAALLQTILVAQAKRGLTAVVDREMDCLARIAQREPDDLGTGNVRSRDVLSLGNNQILTGLTK